MIYALFDELTTSSFAEGCEDRIARGLEARTNAQLLTLANEKGTWTPKGAESPNDQAQAADEAKPRYETDR